MATSTVATLTGCATHQEYRIEQMHPDSDVWIHPHFPGSIGRDHGEMIERLAEAVASAGAGIRHRLVARTVSILTTGWVERSGTNYAMAPQLRLAPEREDAHGH
jgi:hypothetical protein